MDNPNLAHWKKAPTQDIVQYIIKEFHTPLKAKIPNIGDLFIKEMHSSVNPRLVRAYHCFNEFVTIMELHLLQEETILFPVLISLEKETNVESLNSLTPFIKAMEKDHLADLRFAEEMKDLTNCFQPPSFASANLVELFEALNELIKDLDLHIKIETDLIFKRFLQ